MERQRFTRALAATVVSGLLVVGAGACGKAAEKVGEKVAEKSLEGVTGADVDASDDGVTIKTEDGEFSAKTTDELPDGWPVDLIAVPDGFSIESVSETKTPDGAMTAVSIEGSGDIGDLVDSYVDALEGAGIEVAMQTKSSDGGMVSAEKDGVNYMIMLNSDGDGTVTGVLSLTDTGSDGS